MITSFRSNNDTKMPKTSDLAILLHTMVLYSWYYIYTP